MTSRQLLIQRLLADLDELHAQLWTPEQRLLAGTAGHTVLLLRELLERDAKAAAERASPRPGHSGGLPK